MRAFVFVLFLHAPIFLSIISGCVADARLNAVKEMELSPRSRKSAVIGDSSIRKRRKNLSCRWNLHSVMTDLRRVSADARACLDDKVRLWNLLDEVNAKEDGHGVAGELKASNKRDRTIIMTTAVESEMDELRELVGSVHNLRQSDSDVTPIVVYAFGVSQRYRREISLWRNVEVIDADEVLFVGQNSVPSSSSEPEEPPSAVALHRSTRITFVLMELLLRKYRDVLYVRVDYAFARDTIGGISTTIKRNGFFLASEMNQLAESDVTSLNGLYGATAAGPFQIVSQFEKAAAWAFTSDSMPTKLFISLQLRCLRGYRCDSWFRKQLLDAQRAHLRQNLHHPDDVALRPYDNKTATNRTRFHCYVLLRDDILYAVDYKRDDHGDEDSSSKEAPPKSPQNNLAASGRSEMNSHSSRKISIAIGMPTLSAKDLKSFEEVSPIRIMIPSLLKTVTCTEWQEFEFRVYFGFDEGDPYFDNVLEREKIHKHLVKLVEETKSTSCANATVRFNYLRFPFSKGWVTYVWNGIFVRAMHDGAHYFYQVNDDLELKDAGWTSHFTSSLSQNGDVGVAGPWDNYQSGKLLTQAFVSRKHYAIFGRLYPLDIKDWYSDNWLNEVYGTSNRFSTPNITAVNKNDKGTRYNACEEQPRYEELLSAGRRMIRDWLDGDDSLRVVASGSAATATGNKAQLNRFGDGRLRAEMETNPLL